MLTGIRERVGNFLMERVDYLPSRVYRAPVLHPIFRRIYALGWIIFGRN